MKVLAQVGTETEIASFMIEGNQEQRSPVQPAYLGVRAEPSLSVTPDKMGKVRRAA